MGRRSTGSDLSWYAEQNRGPKNELYRQMDSIPGKRTMQGEHNNARESHREGRRQTRWNTPWRTAGPPPPQSSCAALRPPRIQPRTANPGGKLAPAAEAGARKLSGAREQGAEATAPVRRTARTQAEGASNPGTTRRTRALEVNLRRSPIGEKPRPNR